MVMEDGGLMVKDKEIITCRICLQAVRKTEFSEKSVVTPCNCTGSIGTIHVDCFKTWLKYRNSNQCEICNTRYNLNLKSVGNGSYSKYVSDDPSAGPIVAILTMTGFYTWLLFKLDIVSMSGIKEGLIEFGAGNVTALNTIGLAAGSLAAFTWSSLLGFHLNRFRNWRKKNVSYELVN